MTTTQVSGGPDSSRMPGWLDELTVGWLTDALRSTDTIDTQTTVSEFSWDLLGDGEGFLGDLARVRLAYDGGDGPATAVVKVPTRKPENRGFGLLIKAYENEARFYNELAADVSVRTPANYFSAIEDNTRSSAIVERVLDLLPERVTLMLLGRLAAAAGKSDRRALVMIEDLDTARIGDQVAGASLADAERALDILAEFHAMFWNSPKLSAKWLARLDDSVLVAHGLYERAWPVFEERFRDQIQGRNREVLDAITARGPDLLRRICEGPLTLLHGDFRMDNLAFFDGADPPAGMIDFQGVVVGHPVADLAYFIRPNMDPDLADASEDDLLERYHAGLVRHGVSDYPLDSLRDDYELGQLWLLHRGVTLIGTLDLSHERGVQIVDRAIERGLRVADRHRPDRWF